MNYLNIYSLVFYFLACLIIKSGFNGVNSSNSSRSTKYNFIGHIIKKRIIIIIYFYKVYQPRNYLTFEIDITNLKFKRYYIHIL
jgi:hypothetical protein